MGVVCYVVSELLEKSPPPPSPRQPERILNDQSVLSAAIVNDTVLHQALGNNMDHCATTLLAKRGHSAMLLTTKLCHSRVVARAIGGRRGPKHGEDEG